MKILKIFTLLCLLISCTPKSEVNVAADSEQPVVQVKDLNAAFLAGWNTKDSTAIMQTIADNAIVMNDSLIHNGKEVIAKNWVSGGVRVLSNIKTNTIIHDIGDRIAFDGGTYTLDLTIPGGPVLKERGNYNIIWNKQETGEWKLTLVHIEDITRLPDVQ